MRLRRHLTLSVVVLVGGSVVAAPPSRAESSGALRSDPLVTLHADRLAVGTNHVCAIDSAGVVRCWGLADNGALGVPGGLQGQPVDIGGLAIAVDAGTESTCAIRSDRALFCWGSSASSHHGHPGVGDIGDDETPFSVGPVDTGGRDVVEIAVGDSHSCATFDDLTMRCWGSGSSGKLGQASLATIGDNETPGSVAAIDLGPGRYAVAMALGSSHTCAVLDNGALRCFGGDPYHGLPTANQDIGDNETPGSVGTVDVGAGRTVVAVSALGFFTCAILDNATIRCFGAQLGGELGLGHLNTIGDDETPGSVSALPLTMAPEVIAAGAFHACAVERTDVVCWGRNVAGALGLAHTDDIGDDEVVGDSDAVNVGVHRIVALDAGLDITCALSGLDQLRCWGRGQFGVPYLGTNGPDVGDDESPNSVAPIELDGLAALPDSRGYYYPDIPAGSGLATGDFDGDGHDDLAIGAPGAAVKGEKGAGEVRVQFGASNGISFTGGQKWTQARLGVADFPEAGDRFGHALAAGDFNGDGRDDLAVGVPHENYQGVIDTGIVHVFPGGPSGLRATGSQLWSQSPRDVPGNSELGDAFGSALAVGDFDGDGYDDLAIGADQETIGTVLDAGAVTVLRGSPAGLTTTGATLWHQDVTGIADAAQSGDEFGRSLAAGDFNGDGRDELAIGVPRESFGVWNEAGAVAVLRGSTNGLTATADQIWTLDSSGVDGNPFHGEEFGAVLAASDFDADGRDDLAIGVPLAYSPTIDQAGAVLTMYGSGTGLAAARSAEWTADSSGVPGTGEAGDRFGADLATGDIDGDGRADLAITTLGEETVVEQGDAGEVIVLYGSASGVATTGAETWSQSSVGVPETSELHDWFGSSLTLGDWNNDGYGDLAVGTNESLDGIAFAGSLHGFYGAATGLVSGGSFVWYHSTIGGTNQPQGWFAS